MTDQQQTPEEASEQQESQAAAEQVPPEAEVHPVNVLAVLRTCIALLENHAWQAMGLRPDPITGQVLKDLEQARLAIDSIAVLVDRMQPHLREAEARELGTLLVNLRLNFVRQQ